MLESINLFSNVNALWWTVCVMATLFLSDNFLQFSSYQTYTLADVHSDISLDLAIFQFTRISAYVQRDL